MYNMIPCAMRHNPFTGDLVRTFFGEGFADGFLGADRSMQVDVRDEGDHYVVQADVPGFSKEELHADVKEGVLTISAERKQSEEVKDDQGRYLYRERRYGKASRSFSLDGIREEDITAQYQNGVLTLNLPKAQEAEKEAVHSIAIA